MSIFRLGFFRLAEQAPPEARRVTDTVVERFEHVFEVDPALMERTGQQHVPAWDTQRIVDSRWEHLAWMHDHFADEVLLAGEESETMPPGPDEMPSGEEAGPTTTGDTGDAVRGLTEAAVDRPEVRE